MIRRFNRFELKYLVSCAQRDALLPELQARMQPDPEGSESGAYRVTSLYFDTVDLAFSRSKREGIKFRRKLRIRTYGDGLATPEALTMVELKQRIDRTVQKRRLALPLSQAYALCAGMREAPIEDERDARVAGEVEFLVRSLSLAPTCVVSYTRHAFMGGPYEPGLRVTFDGGLWCAGPERGLAPVERLYFLQPDRMVLEVKANDAVPLWIARLLAQHSISITRYSKYCNGVARLRSEKLRSQHG